MALRGGSGPRGCETADAGDGRGDAPPAGRGCRAVSSSRPSSVQRLPRKRCRPLGSCRPSPRPARPRQARPNISIRSSVGARSSARPANTSTDRSATSQNTVLTRPCTSRNARPSSYAGHDAHPHLVRHHQRRPEHARRPAPATSAGRLLDPRAGTAPPMPEVDDPKGQAVDDRAPSRRPRAPPASSTGSSIVVQPAGRAARCAAIALDRTSSSRASADRDQR